MISSVILLRELLEQVQEYVDGALIYIPKTAGHKKRWGEGTSTRQELRFRNQQIYSDYLSGLFIFHLYVSTLFIKQELGWYPPVRMLHSLLPAEPVLRQTDRKGIQYERHQMDHTV